MGFRPTFSGLRKQGYARLVGFGYCGGYTGGYLGLTSRFYMLLWRPSLLGWRSFLLGILVAIWTSSIFTSSPLRALRETCRCELPRKIFSEARRGCGRSILQIHDMVIILQKTSVSSRMQTSESAKLS